MHFLVSAETFLVFARPAAMILTAVVSILMAARVRAAEPAGAAFKAGVAFRVITPKESLWLSGYGNRTKPAEGKIQDLYVKALALEDAAGGRLVLLTSDLVGFQRPLTEAVAEKVRRRTGLPRERLLLSASHTHSGPLLRGPFVDHFDLPPEQVKKIEEYTDRLRDYMVEAILAALADLRPARLAAGRGTARFAMNRRQPTPRGIVGGYNPEGPVDHDVPVLRIESLEGKLRAVVFGYACHNVTLRGADFYRWSGDYAGFAQAYLEEKHSGATALFWCGCGGDARPKPLGTVEICRRHGRELADAVEDVLTGRMTPMRGETAARYALVSLPFASLPSKEKLLADRSSKRTDVRKRAIRLLKVLDAGGKIDDHYRYYPIQVWRLGDGPLWVSLGGEVLADYSLRLKKELGHDRPLWITAYANDVMAYIPSRRVLQEGGYEPDTSTSVYGLPAKWAPAIEDKIVAKIHELVKEATPKKSSASPLSPKEELATFHVAKGFRIELVACEPAIIDPVAMAFDEDGRLFVAEMRGYNSGVALERIQRNTSGTTKGQGSAAANWAAAIERLTSGTIKLLEDRDGDGFYEHSRVFADKLRLPTSVLPYKGGVLAAMAPDLLYLEDTDGDGRADRRRTLYTGFGIKNPQGMVNGLQWGLDNWVYGNASTSDSAVRSAEKADQPALMLRYRGFRFHPDKPGSLEPTSGGGQYGLAADDWGQWFVNTNSKHLRHIVLPDHYLRRNPALAVPAVTHDIPDGKDGHDAACKVYRLSPFEPWRIERARRNRERGAWWIRPQDKGKTKTPNRPLLPSSEMAAGGYITAACSPIVHTADLFPESYRGNTFICEPANNLIHRDILAPQGATFVARRGEAESEFLASTDPWFRPVHLSLGPDGALYVLDFYREVIEDAPDIPEDVRRELKLNTGSNGRGRIWRIVPEDAPRPKKPALRRAPTAELVQHLADGNSWRRLTAQRLLVERQDKAAVPLLVKLAREAARPVGRAHALWALQGLGALEGAQIEQALKDPAAGVREQALRLAEPHLATNARLRAAATALADDDSPRVRFQLAFTLGEADGPEVLAALARVARRDAADPWTQTAVLSSVHRTASALLQTLTRDRDFTGKTEGPQLQLLTRLAALVGAGATDTELAQVMRLLASSAEEDSVGWQRAVLEGLGQGLRNGRRASGRLWERPPPTLRESLAQLRPFFQRAAATARDDKRPIPERIAAIRLLGYGPFAIAAPALQELLNPRHSAEVQLAAVRALALHDDPKVAELLLDGWDRLTPTVRREVLEALFARSYRLSQLLTAIERKKVLAAQLEPARVEQLRKHPNDELRRRAQALLEAPDADRRKVVEDYRSALRLSADVARGKTVFQKTCAACHRLGDVGTEVGPDLASALRNKTPEGLLTDILDPSREVDPRYINYVVTARDGRTFTGLIAAETAASITLRRAEKAENTLLRTRIEEIQGTGKSIMPEGLETQLSKQNVADVIAYLLSQAMPNYTPRGKNGH